VSRARASVTAAVALAAAAAGCASPARAPRAPLVDVTPADTGDDGGSRLLRELELEVLASYQRVSLDAASAAAAIDPQVGLTAIGVAPAELGAGGLASRWPIADVEGAPVEVVSRALELRLSADRTVGWAFDQISLRLPVCGRTATIPLRAAQIYARDSERWTLVSEHLAYAQPVGRWIEEATGPLGLAMPTVVEGHADARAAAAALAAALAPHADRAVTWDHGADALAVWPDPLQILRGGAVRTGPGLAASLDARELRLEGVRLALGPGRGEAIAATTLLATIDRAATAQRPAGPVDVRLRVTAVLELAGDDDDDGDRDAGGGRWRVRMAMVSAAIPVPALVARTLGVIATSTGNRVTTRCSNADGRVAGVSAPRAPSR
jgi:hypothetical protein